MVVLICQGDKRPFSKTEHMSFFIATSPHYFAYRNREGIAPIAQNLGNSGQGLVASAMLYV